VHLHRGGEVFTERGETDSIMSGLGASPVPTKRERGSVTGDVDAFQNGERWKMQGLTRVNVKIIKIMSH